MKRLFCVVLGSGLCSILSVETADAVTIELSPAAQSVAFGGSVDVDVIISALGEITAPSLGAFDLDVGFDPGVLVPTAVSFGPFLGDPSLLEASTFAALLFGLVDLAETSFLADLELDALQSGTFVLATLSFDAVGLGTSPLDLSEVLLGDAFGNSLSATPFAGSVTVIPTVVPAPGTPWLIVAGWLGGFLCRRGRGPRGCRRGESEAPSP